MMPAASAATSTPIVSLISNDNSLPNALSLLQKAIGSSSGTTVKSSSTSCNSGVDGNSDLRMIEDYSWSYNSSVLFGPPCNDGAYSIMRLIHSWNSLDFDFWMESFPSSTNMNTLHMSVNSASNVAQNLLAVFSAFNWNTIALISCETCYDDSLNTGRISTIRQMFLKQNINIAVTVELNQTQSTDSRAIATAILPIKTQARVMIALLGNSLDSYVNFLQALTTANMSGIEFAPVIQVFQYPTSSGSTFASAAGQLSLPWMKGTSVDTNILNLFSPAFIMSNEYYMTADIQKFVQNMSLQAATSTQLLLYSQLYESVWLYSNILSSTNLYQQSTNGANIASGVRMATQTGPFGAINFDANNQRVSPFKVYFVDNSVNSTSQSSLAEVLNISIVHQCGQNAANDSCFSLTATLIPIGITVPPDMPTCGFNGEVCGQRTVIVIAIVVVIVIAAAIVAFVVFWRIRGGGSSTMPWAIPSSLISFVASDVGGSSNMSIHSLHPYSEANGFIGGDTLRARQLATMDQSFVIVDAYKIRDKLVLDKKDMQLLYQLKQFIHDNINAFIGVCLDRSPTELLIVWRYLRLFQYINELLEFRHCFRGTLSDILFSPKSTRNERDSRSSVSLGGAIGGYEAAVLDNNFKGLDFIHNSPIGYHGSLTAVQCFIDSHWILKISGFGISRSLFKWCLKNSLIGRFGAPLIPNSELHYYAPELREEIKSAFKRSRPDDLNFSPAQGQAQDMYAFGVILYEVLYRKKIVSLEDTITAMTEVKEGNGVFSPVAESRLPFNPSFPTGSSVGENGENGTVHPDLINLMTKCFSRRVDERPDANMARKRTDATLKISGSLVDQMIKNMEQYTGNLENLVKEQTGQLEEEQNKLEQILTELLPKTVVDVIRMGHNVEPQLFDNVTVMYSDIVGFTSMCSDSSPLEVVTLLNGMFRAFDDAISRYNAYKVETIGDAYCVASGVPIKSEIEHVREIALIALRQREFLKSYEIPHRPGNMLHCRWGFNSGSVFTGVVGITAPRYCIFGKTVTLASKMENSGQPDHIQMTLKSHQLLKSASTLEDFRCRPRGVGVRIDGMGTFLTYWLDGSDNRKLRESIISDLQVHPLPPTPPKKYQA